MFSKEIGLPEEATFRIDIKIGSLFDRIDF